MTTPYSVSVNRGSVTYNGYVNAPILGPLSTDNTPGNIPKSFLGTLPTIRQTPQQFYPAQNPPDSNQNSNMRFYYRRTAISTPQRAQQIIAAKKSTPMAVWSPSTGNLYAAGTHTNYIEPMPSSMYMNVKKSIAVGKSSYSSGMPTQTPISTKSYFPTEARSHLRRVRSGGCIAPKKKGALENRSLSNGAIWSWGSIPRSTYS